MDDFNNNFDYNYSPVQPAKTRRMHSTGAVILSAVLAALIGAGSAVAVLTGVFKKNSGTGDSGISVNPSNISINVDENADSIAQAVAEKCTASVVGIRTTTSVSSFFGGSQEQNGSGSGVVYSSDGYIITNYHVISDVVEAGKGKIEVFLGSSESTAYDASVVGYRISADIAVLKIDAKNLAAVEFADSDELKVGQYVVTIGAPGGLEFMGSVTYGIISGLNRVVSTSQSVPLIQTDAAINPGNSGGALLDATGKLVGINSSKIVSEEFEGMGFAIPSNTVKEICKKIIDKKDSKEPYVGITISEKYTSDVLKYYGYPSGAVVLRVDSDSPADKAGIKRGDIITKFNGKNITEYSMLSEYVNDCDVNDTVEVEIYRNGGTFTAKLTIGSNS